MTPAAAAAPADSVMDSRGAAIPAKARPMALSKFAASVVKEEVRKQKKKRKRAVDAGETKRHDASSKTKLTEKKSVADGEATSLSRLAQSPGLGGSSAGVSSRDAAEIDEFGGAQAFQEEWDEPSDTLVAVKMMCQQFPKLEKVAVRPFVLRSQLYSSVNNRTLVDRELEDLRQKQVVRVFKLNSGNDDFGIMFMDDYLKQIEEVKKREDSRRPGEESRVFTWFAERVLPAHNELSIRHSHLVEILSEAGKLSDKHLTLLIRNGLLVRQMGDESTYWFSMPNIGTILKSLSAGRKELLSFLSRRRYKEMTQAALEKKRLRSSQLDIRFHVRDLIGLGHLFVIQTNVGPVLRVARD